MLADALPGLSIFRRTGIFGLSFTAPHCLVFGHRPRIALPMAITVLCFSKLANGGLFLCSSWETPSTVACPTHQHHEQPKCNCLHLTFPLNSSVSTCPLPFHPTSEIVCVLQVLTQTFSVSVWDELSWYLTFPRQPETFNICTLLSSQVEQTPSMKKSRSSPRNFLLNQQRFTIHLGTWKIFTFFPYRPVHFLSINIIKSTTNTYMLIKALLSCVFVCKFKYRESFLRSLAHQNK